MIDPNAPRWPFSDLHATRPPGVEKRCGRRWASSAVLREWAMRTRALTAVLVASLALVVPSACGGTDDGAVPSDGTDGGPPPTHGQPSVPEGGTPVDADANRPDTSASPTCTGKLGAPGDKPITLMVGGKERNLNLHVPPAYDATKRTPLVFLFHGYTMTASEIAAATHFAATADKHGMIVAFPNGIQKSFNAGDCCGTAQSDNVDDVAFTSAMIDALATDYCIDAKRVFSAGFSNGGFLSYRLACELSDRIAAVAPVAGGLRIDVAACNPKRPVPVLHIHGTSDLLVPYDGGFGAPHPVSYSIDAFKTKNGCAAGAGKVVYTKDDVSCTKWDGCTANADVELCTVTSGGHQWPGGDTLPYGGSASPNLDSSETIAEFFEAHPLP
jgi:polyhydroxybutyrate depolymerase